MIIESWQLRQLKLKFLENLWGLQACKTGVRPDRIWINTVGTFGIGSAAYHWSRLMSGIGRAAFYMLGQSEVFMLVYVDDLLWITRDKRGIEKIILTIYFMNLYDCSWFTICLEEIQRRCGPGLGRL